MRQILYKTVAGFLSIALIFTSAAPSLAQTQPKSPFKVSASNALENAVQRHVAQTLDQAQDAWWVERGEKLVVTQCGLNKLPCIVNTLFKAKAAAPKQDILQAVVCDKQQLSCVPALAYAWGGIHYAAKNLLYHQDKPILETAPHLVTLITEYGLHSEEDRQALRTYFYKLLKEAQTDCDSGPIQSKWEIGSQDRRADARHANEIQAKRCTAEVAVLPALAMLEKTTVEKVQALQQIYSLLKKRYNSEQGAEVIYGAVTALGILGTQAAYKDLEHFITQDTIPGTLGNIWEGIWAPGKSTAQNSLRVASNMRGGNSRYLNRINEQFQYVDKTEAKRQGFNNTTWQSEGRQYPYGNILEEVGILLGEQSAANPYARALAKKLVHQANKTAQNKTNAAGTLHYPVILGILGGWQKHGKQFIYEPSPALLSLFYKGDWFDINEGTQRRIHQKAYQFAKARGWAWQAPVFDKDKNKRYIYNSRILALGQATDAVAPLLVAEGLFRVVPALTKGIPSAVRILRGRSTTLVGTKNYLQRVPPGTLANVKAPTAKEVPLKPMKPAQKQVVTGNVKFKVAQVDSKTAQLVPEGYTPNQLNPDRLNIAPKTFASQGAPYRNTKKVQSPVAKQTDFTAGTSNVAQSSVTPKYIWGQSTNQLGQTVPSMVPNPAHPQYAQLVTQAAKNFRPFSLKNLWQDIQLTWQLNKPHFSQLFQFSTSRYGWAGLGGAATPVTSEGVIWAADNAQAVVQIVRTQQSTFATEEILRGVAGASYRTGAVNPGGVAAARYAQSALNAALPTKAAVLPLAGTGSTQTIQAATSRYASAMAYSLVFPVPSFIINYFMQPSRPTRRTGQATGNKNRAIHSYQNRSDNNFIAGRSMFQLFETYYPNWQAKTNALFPGYVTRIKNTFNQTPEDFSEKAEGVSVFWIYSVNSLNRGASKGKIPWAYYQSLNSNKKIRTWPYEVALTVVYYLKAINSYTAKYSHPLFIDSNLYQEAAHMLVHARQTIGMTAETQLLASLLKSAVPSKEYEKAQLEQKSIALIEQRAAQEALAARQAQERAAKQAEQEARKRKASRDRQRLAAQQEARRAKALEKAADAQTDANAILAAQAAESRFTRLTHTTEDFILELLNFYNTLSPFGTGKREKSAAKANAQARLDNEAESAGNEPNAQEAPQKQAANAGEIRVTGRQILTDYYPTWRQELGSRFTPEQLDTIEKAFADTDDRIFVRTQEGKLQIRNQDEWDYEGRFLTNLKGSGVEFTDKQLKYLTGARGIRGFFARYFTLLNAVSFSAATGKLPRQRIGKGSQGKAFTLTELRARAAQGDDQAAKLARELQIGRKLAKAKSTWDKASPQYQPISHLYQQYRYNTVRQSNQKLYKQLAAHIKDYGHYPRITEGPLYQNISRRLAYYQSARTQDGQYIDPWLQKIYELKTAAQAAGNKTLNKEGNATAPVAQTQDLQPQKQHAPEPGSVNKPQEPTGVLQENPTKAPATLPRPQDPPAPADKTAAPQAAQATPESQPFDEKAALPLLSDEAQEANTPEDLAHPLVFNDGATPATAKEQLNNFLEAFHKLGYTVYMGTRELGLTREDAPADLQAFRTGRLHLQAVPAGPQTTTDDINIEIALDAAPIHGLLQTGLEMRPDNEIAQNYLELFEMFLTDEAKQALNDIITPPQEPLPAQETVPPLIEPGDPLP